MATSSKRRDDLLKDYLTTKSKSQELIGKLGLRNDCETPGKARPKFNNPTVKSLYDKTGDIVNRLSTKSLQELREDAKQEDFLQEDLDRILRQHGEAIWGRDERSHMHDREASVTLFCQDNLYWDNAEDRETIKLYVLCWVLNRAAAKTRRKVDSPLAKATVNFPNVRPNASSDSDSDSSVPGLNIPDFSSPFRTPVPPRAPVATMPAAPVAPMFGVQNNPGRTVGAEVVTPSNNLNQAGRTVGREPVSPKAPNHAGKTFGREQVTPSKAPNHTGKTGGREFVSATKIQRDAARTVARVPGSPPKTIQHRRGKNLRRRDSMGYQFVSSDSQFPPEQDHESDSDYVDNDDSSQETLGTKHKKRRSEDAGEKTPGKLRRVHKPDALTSPMNRLSVESTELPLRNSFAAVRRPVPADIVRIAEAGRRQELDIFDVDLNRDEDNNIEMDSADERPLLPLPGKPRSRTSREPSIELGGFVAPDTQETYDSLFDDRSPTISAPPAEPAAPSEILRQLHRQTTPHEEEDMSRLRSQTTPFEEAPLDWTTIKEPEQLANLNSESKKIQLLFLLIHRLHNCGTFTDPDHSAEQQLDMLLTHIYTQEKPSIQQKLGSDFDRLERVFKRWKDMRSRIYTLQHSVNYFSGPGENFARWKDFTSNIDDVEQACHAMRQLVAARDWARSMKERDRWFDQSSFDADLATFLEPMVETILCDPRRRLPGGPYNRELLVWFE